MSIAGLLLPRARVRDITGGGTVLIAGVTLLTGGTLVTGFARGLPMLLAGRIVRSWPAR